VPLTKRGRAVQRSFSRRYGKRGKSVFYATMNKRGGMPAKLHRKRRTGRRRRRRGK
jgi:hypothetical protein